MEFNLPVNIDYIGPIIVLRIIYHEINPTKFEDSSIIGMLRINTDNISQTITSTQSLNGNFEKI